MWEKTPCWFDQIFTGHLHTKGTAWIALHEWRRWERTLCLHLKKIHFTISYKSLRDAVLNVLNYWNWSVYHRNNMSHFNCPLTLNLFLTFQTDVCWVLFEAIWRNFVRRTTPPTRLLWYPCKYFPKPLANWCILHPTLPTPFFLPPLFLHFSQGTEGIYRARAPRRIIRRSSPKPIWPTKRIDLQSYHSLLTNIIIKNQIGHVVLASQMRNCPCFQVLEVKSVDEAKVTEKNYWQSNLMNRVFFSSF